MTVQKNSCKKINLENLEKKIVEFLPRTLKALVNLPDIDESYPIVSGIFEKTNVLDYEFDRGLISVTFEALPWIVNKIRSRVEELGGEFIDKAG